MTQAFAVAAEVGLCVAGADGLSAGAGASVAGAAGSAGAGGAT